ncbi:MAG: hypothetical protein JWQ01_1135 [Massilia sp.]|nr:hypothetical protein [Massilia sp.]
MPHVYSAVDSLGGHQLVGKGDCVDLVKEYAPGLKGWKASQWRQGAKVLETRGLKRGTAIATFVDGRYPDNKTGQHAAFFLKHAGAAIWVMDQWKNDENKPRVSKRLIYPGGPVSANTRLSNNAAAFYVIETK